MYSISHFLLFFTCLFSLLLTLFCSVSQMKESNSQEDIKIKVQLMKCTNYLALLQMSDTSVKSTCLVFLNPDVNITVLVSVSAQNIMWFYVLQYPRL